MYGTASVVNGAAAMAFLPRLVEGHFLQRAHALSATGALVMITAGSGLADWPSVVVLAAGELLFGLAMGMSNSPEMSYRQLVTRPPPGPHQHLDALPQPGRDGRRRGRPGCHAVPHRPRTQLRYGGPTDAAL